MSTSILKLSSATRSPVTAISVVGPETREAAPQPPMVTPSRSTVTVSGTR